MPIATIVLAIRRLRSLIRPKPSGRKPAPSPCPLGSAIPTAVSELAPDSPPGIPTRVPSTTAGRSSGDSAEGRNACQVPIATRYEKSPRRKANSTLDLGSRVVLGPCRPYQSAAAHRLRTARTVVRGLPSRKAASIIPRLLEKSDLNALALFAIGRKVPLRGSGGHDEVAFRLRERVRGRGCSPRRLVSPDACEHVRRGADCVRLERRRVGRDRQ